MLIAHEDGTVATYARSTGIAGYTDIGTQSLPTFSIGGNPPLAIQAPPLTHTT